MNTFPSTPERPVFQLGCCLGVLLCLLQNPISAQSGRSFAPPTDKNLAPLRQASEEDNTDTRGGKPLEPLPDEASHLRDDPRLQRKVTLDELGTPLVDLLNKLSSDKLMLKADPDCREFKLQIHLKQRPLHVLMQSLASLYDGYWQERTDKRGYRFAQRLQTIRRRDAWWHLYLTEREQALKQISAAIIADMNQPVKARDPNAPEYQKEPGDPETEAMTARSHNVFGQFDGTLQQRIARSLDPIFTCDMEGFQGFLPQEGGAVARLRDLPPDAQKIVQQHAGAFFASANPFIHFSNTGDYIGSQLVRPGGGWAEAGLQVAGIRRPSALVMAVCWVNHAQLARLLPALPARKQDAQHTPSALSPRSNIPEGWQQLADWQRSRIWPNNTGKILYRKIRRVSSPVRIERLRWLARQAGMEYVSDYYAHAGRHMEEDEHDQPLTRPLKEELDALALEQDVSWKCGEDTVHLFRNNRWYRDDELEIPDAYARALLPRCVSTFMEEPHGERKAGNDRPRFSLSN